MKIIECQYGTGTAEELALDYAEYRLECVWEYYAPDSFHDCSEEEFAAIEKAFITLRVVSPEEVPNQ